MLISLLLDTSAPRTLQQHFRVDKEYFTIRRIRTAVPVRLATTMLKAGK
jgi:hypothetical protein